MTESEGLPLLGETETTRQFNEKFHMNKPIHSIVNHCCKEGIKVNKQVANKNHSVFNTRAYETGGIKYLNDRQYIKSLRGCLAHGATQYMVAII